VFHPLRPLRKVADGVGSGQFVDEPMASSMDFVSDNRVAGAGGLIPVFFPDLELLSISLELVESVDDLFLSFETDSLHGLCPGTD
jgi:hypothetical protein